MRRGGTFRPKTRSASYWKGSAARTVSPSSAAARGWSMLASVRPATCGSPITGSTPPAALGKTDEALQTLGADQGVVVFFGMAKPVRTPQIGPVRQPLP